MEYVKNYIKLLDKISNTLELPLIRKYVVNKGRHSLKDSIEYLSELGYEETSLLRGIQATVPDYISLYSFVQGHIDVFIGSVSENVLIYDDILETFDNSNIEELLNMSDEEFELLVRLN